MLAKNENLAISQIKLMKKPSIIVEGYSDMQFLRFLFGKNVEIVYFDYEKNIKYGEICNKQKVVNTIKKIEKSNYKNDYIGIIDKDYDSIDTDDKLLYYDCNDLESMVLKCGSYDKIIKYYLKSVDSKSEIDRCFFECLHLVGSIRKINHDENYWLDFKSANFIKFLGENFKFDINNYIRQLNYKKGEGVNEERVDAILKSIEMCATNDWNNIRGHDAVCLLSKLISEHKLMICKYISYNMTGDLVINSFEKEWLYKTSFYMSLKKSKIGGYLYVEK
jgi:hypothetical protein